ncbi:hypothetical protein Q8F57_003145 [Paraburkholderia terrae]|uniref:hypothetical protein n=1 Tax=Paraburkholderia terrae TaxID=311230 RepID=UPI00296B50F5|nr:hypothetical protein [Paraburkholderia terrae]MDW3655479.1 hypothetical protein [Paraburkholderia terrae]
MYQVDDPTAAASFPTPAAAGTAGYFTDGNPGSGVAATILRADFMNALMLELMNVVSSAGITLSKTAQNQLLLSIKRLVQSQVVLTDTGAVNAYAATNNPALVAGTWANGVVQQFVVGHTNTGASTYAPDGLPSIPIYGLGLQPLQGSEMFAGGTAILMKQTIAGVNSGNPIAVLLECAGGTQQIPAATQPLHAMQLGQATGRLINGGPTVYTAGATWNRNPATTFVIVEVQAAGGGTGGAPATGASQYSGSPGASSGSYAKVLLTAAQAGSSQTITAGAPGTAGATGTSAGGTGGTASFGSIISCPGGPGSSSYGPTGTTTSIQNAPSSAGLPTISAGTVLISTPGNTGGYAIGTLTGVASAQGGAAPINGSTTSEGAGGRGTGIGASTSAVPGAVGGGSKIIVWEFA